MAYGNHGKLLRINLLQKSFRIEEISAGVWQEAIGGKGLGTYLLSREVDPAADPLSADNKLIFVTGPACDTRIPASSRYGVFSKSPLTGIYAESYAGGHVAPLMKRTGFDAIILEDKAISPVFLHINQGGVTFYEAESIWGMETYDAEDYLKKTGGSKCQALVIGPAGENLVKFACIKNNYWRSAGRTGLGAVMGSKMVKGLVFTGEAKTPLADPLLLKSYIGKLKDQGKTSSAVKAYFNYGTPMMVSILNEVNSFPTRYWYQGSAEHKDSISAEYMKDNLHVKPKACRGCFIACGKKTTVPQGRYKGLTIEGPEYETIYSFGGLCCVKKLEEIVFLNDLCDRLGIDTISTGNLVAFSIEGRLRGKIKNGPRYSDVVSMASLIKDISFRKGLGDILAEGIRTAAQNLDLSDIAIHVKGMEPAGYDPRILKGMGLGYATSDRGACHLRATFYKPELSGIISPEQIEGKAALFIDYEDRMTLFDCLIFCRFYRDLVDWGDLSTIIAATTGMQFDKDKLQKKANAIVGYARSFNLKAGITAKDDTLPPRFFQEPLNKEGRQSITRAELEYMVKDYYKLRGWDEEGKPAGKED
ncbi:MAG: aldehyde ferredoxin oxidoreductase family protein [Bacillota bacterium]